MRSYTELLKYEMERRRRRKEERKQERKRRMRGYTKKCAGKYIAHGFCRACGGSKEEESRQHCKKCERRRRSANLKRQYGITADEYDRLVEIQNNVCWICGEKETTKRGYLHVDHCHKTGRVRGLLCSKCNAGVGMFRNSPELLDRAIAYLNQFND